MVPQDEEQQKFVDEVNGRRAAESQYALCWLKYLKRSTGKHVVYNLCSTSRNGAEDYSEAEGRIG